MKIPDIKTVNIENKKVFVLSDLDVTVGKEGEIADDTRLVAGWPTIEYLLNKSASIIVGGKIGRPDGKVVPELTLEPVAKWYQQKFKTEVSRVKIGDFDGWKITENFSLLENLRFHPGEEKNDPEFAKRLANLADIYVNDAFSLSHRTHASVMGLPKLLPKFGGLHLQKEIEELTQVLENPIRPLVAIIGGAKIETKLPLVKKMLTIADYVLVGGKVAHEFNSNVKYASEFQNHEKIKIASLNSEYSDITKESIDAFLEIITAAKTIVWNGPVGIVENLATESGTKELANAIVSSSAYKVVGGGDTVEFLNRIGLLNKFDFVSTGGGAMLEFLSGDKLPGVEALLV